MTDEQIATLQELVDLQGQLKKFAVNNPQE